MSGEPLRRPARFAGTWYPADPVALRAELAAASPSDGGSLTRARAVIAPHAGYRFSLGVAQAAYARVEIPPVVVVLCPNHTVPPPLISFWPSGSWETPLGAVPIDEELTARILAELPGARGETGAHEREHAVELHLPILRDRQPGLRLVAGVVAAPDFASLERLGQALARCLADREDVLLVASTDMTHFESAASARRKDELALERLEALDPAGLLEVCERERISMCGVRPTAAALVAAKELGATRAERVRYATSGDVTGDDSSVVAYAAAVVR